MKQRTWGGRFKKAQSKQFLDYSASIGFDKKLAPYDIALNVAYSKALHKAKLVNRAELARLVKGLLSIANELEKGKFDFRTDDEDIHMNIERRLKEKLGKLSGKLHTGRSRNDQVATDLRMYVRDRCDGIVKQLVDLQKAILRAAEKNVDGIMPAYSHMQQAQPVRIAHWFLAYREMFARDVKRFRDARISANVMPLGSGALAGTNFDIDRKLLAKLLGFDSVSQNSMDAVSDRDFAVDFCYAVTMLFTHLSRLSEDIIIYATKEFGAITLPDELCTGSSIMPQKKNPDLPELLRGKSGRVTGNLLNLLTMLKGLPMAYNKDLQEDKPPLFDSAEQAADALDLTSQLISKLKFNKKLLKERVIKSKTTAVDMADYLVMKGLPFRDAHHVVGEVVLFSEENGIAFSDLTLKELKKQSKLFNADVFNFIDPLKSPDRKKGTGSTSGKRILEQIKRIKRELK